MFPGLYPIFTFLTQKAIALFHGAPKAGEMVDVEGIALREVEVEKAAPQGGRAGDEFRVFWSRNHRGENT